MTAKPHGGAYRLGGQAKFASEIHVRAPNFAFKNIGDKYPKFCPLNFRYDPKIGILSQLLRLVVTELVKFSLLFGELGWTLQTALQSTVKQLFLFRMDHLIVTYVSINKICKSRLWWNA